MASSSTKNRRAVHGTALALGGATVVVGGAMLLGSEAQAAELGETTPPSEATQATQDQALEQAPSTQQQAAIDEQAAKEAHAQAIQDLGAQTTEQLGRADQAAGRAAALQRDLAAADVELADAQAADEAARQRESEAEEVLANVAAVDAVAASVEHESAQAALAKAEATAQSDRAAAQAAQQKAHAAVVSEAEAAQELKQAQSALSAAEQQAASAQVALDQARAAQSQTTNSSAHRERVAVARKNYDDALKAVDAAQRSVTQAQKAHSDAQAALSRTEREIREGEDTLAAREAELAQKQSAEKAAKSALQPAQAALARAESDLTAKRSVLAQAEAATTGNALTREQIYAKGSRGFFEAMGATTAAKVFDDTQRDPAGKAFSSYTKMGQAGDATHLDNMLRSLDYIDEFNRIRRSEGLTELKVTDRLMAIGQMQANWSRHTYRDFGEGRVHAREHGLGGYYHGENLALTSNVMNQPGLGQNPFQKWYVEERATYLANPSNPAGEVGHYLNIVTPGLVATGYGLGEEVAPWSVQQGFGGNSRHSSVFDVFVSPGEPSFTVAEYRARLQAYMNSSSTQQGSGAALAQTRAEYEAAQQEATEARNALAARQTELNTAIKERESAARARGEAWSALSYAQETRPHREAAKAKAQAGLSSARRQLSTAQTRLVAARAELSNAQKSNTSTSAVRHAEQRLAEATRIKDQASQRASVAKSKHQAAQRNLAQASTARLQADAAAARSTAALSSAKATAHAASQAYAHIQQQAARYDTVKTARDRALADRDATRARLSRAQDRQAAIFHQLQDEIRTERNARAAAAQAHHDAAFLASHSLEQLLAHGLDAYRFPELSGLIAQAAASRSSAALAQPAALPAAGTASRTTPSASYEVMRSKVVRR